MSLSKAEIELLINKLINKYSFYADKFSPVWFNLESFEDRLSMAIKNKMNLEGFILAEIRNFEKLREKYDKRQKDKAFANRVDSILEENVSRIKKYKKIEFHPNAGMEISYFYGAVSDFTLYLFPILWNIADDQDIKNKLYPYENTLNHLALPQGKKKSRRIEDHILILNRQGVREMEIENDKNDYLKETALLLHEIIDLCDGLIQIRRPEWEAPLRFDRLYIEGERKKQLIENFRNHTSYGAIIKIRDRAKEIIDDFRLGAFKKV